MPNRRYYIRGMGSLLCLMGLTILWLWLSVIDPVGPTPITRPMEVTPTTVKEDRCASWREDPGPAEDLHNSSLPRVKLYNTLLFLHLGKAGGGTINDLLSQEWNLTFSYNHPYPRARRRDWIQNHPRGTVLINLRDPVDRFVSAYYWRQRIMCRPQQPQYGNEQERRQPHKSGYLVANQPDTYCRKGNMQDWEILFGPRYHQSAEALAQSLCSENVTVAQQAAQDMSTILHANTGILKWLGPDWQQTALVANQSLFPVVQEKGFDMTAQVDDAIQYAYLRAPFESSLAFEGRRRRIEYQRCATTTQSSGNNASLHSSGSSQKGLSAEGVACLSRYYADDYQTLQHVQEQACPTETCHAAIGSILARRTWLR